MPPLPTSAACLVLMIIASGASGAEQPVDFNREVRPLLSENCFICHGPDEAERKRAHTKLRLDTRDGLFSQLGDIVPVVPGDAGRSEVIRRLTTSDEDDRMPPAKTGKTLSAAQIATISRWIAQGARWQQHWAFVAPVRPEPPAVRDAAWARGDIDRFVLARLERENLRPAPEASRATLIRRLSLDLTGVPPTPAEVDAFAADRSPQAYEAVVDRLLASPRYGERMAMWWLDGARYGDSHGFQADFERSMWRWRDWVIDAFNRDMPFDQFTIEQLAGDLLPDATVEQRVATGFNRNQRINTESGIIAEEWRIENVIDRVDTTGQVWLGLTLGCARCHDHKFDPVSQRDFYRLTAFFNNVPEIGNPVGKPGNIAPFIKAPSPADSARLAAATTAIATARQRVQDLEPDFARQEAVLERQLLDAAPISGEPPLAHLPLATDAADRQGAWPAGVWKGGAAKFGRDDALFGSAAEFDGKTSIQIGGNGSALASGEPFSIACWVKRRGGGEATVLARLDEGQGERGYELALEDGRIAVRLVHAWPDDALKVVAKAAIRDGVWTHVAATYDGSGKATGLVLLVDGKPIAADVEFDALTGAIAVEQPLRVAGRQSGDRFQGALAELRFYRRALAAGEILELARQPARRIAAIVPDQRTAAQREALRRCLRAAVGGTLAEADRTLAEAERVRAELEQRIPTVMVMEELPKPRDAFVLIRGQYDKHGEQVEAGTPAAFPPMAAGAPRNRLGLARWIVDPANPLTARVAANRCWERLFGVGLVKTSENLGSQSEPPSHPELLDWLATELVRQRWDLKSFQRMLVLSATYRQSSAVDPEAARRDPENRLLAHGPRFRLQAEMIRDQALAIAGLLVDKVGGPPVRPYQPAGIWDELSSYGNLHHYQHDRGEDLYRRSLYGIWKRTTPPPDLSLLDMPSREYCVVRRSRTDTPLQALALMNDLTFVEAARALAQRMMRDGGADVAERIAYGFRRALARAPRAEELEILRAGFDRRLARFSGDTAAAARYLGQGDAKPDPVLDAAELAAYATTASTLLNLDETITKE